jgi:hypothetical protein
MSGPWVRSGEGGAMKEMLFIKLATKLLSGATENMGIKHFTFRAKMCKICMSYCVDTNFPRWFKLKQALFDQVY